MKKILFLLLLIPMIGHGQTDMDNYKWDIVDSAKGSKHDLYLKASAWAHSHFQKPLIVLEDSSAGKISINATSPINLLAGVVTYDLEIYVKDDKYRYVADGFVYSSGNTFASLRIDTCPTKILFTKKEKADKMWIKGKHDIANWINTDYKLFKSEMDKEDNNPNW